MATPILSILIPTIEERLEKRLALIRSLESQVAKYAIGHSEVEILYYEDKRGDNTIGYKRNVLLDEATGLFSAFIDDDDSVSAMYIPKILSLVKGNPPFDCISLHGVVTTDGQDARTFIHSLKYKDWFEKGGVYYRPPNHLNPIRSEISKAFKFEEINHGEDHKWSMAICESNAIKTEFEYPNSEPYYFYNFVSKK